MAALWNVVVDVGNGHRVWCPPCQPPNASWLAIPVTWNVRLAAHPLLIPPRIALFRLRGVGLGECGTYRNGSRVSNLIGRMCLYINGCSLTRWMYPVRADAAGRWETTSVDVGIGS